MLEEGGERKLTSPFSTVVSESKKINLPGTYEKLPVKENHLAQWLERSSGIHRQIDTQECFYFIIWISSSWILRDKTMDDKEDFVGKIIGECCKPNQD